MNINYSEYIIEAVMLVTLTMFSGYNSSLLNVFHEKGMEELVKITPWDMLKTTLNNSRYECLDKWLDLI